MITLAPRGVEIGQHGPWQTVVPLHKQWRIALF